MNSERKPKEIPGTIIASLLYDYGEIKREIKPYIPPRKLKHFEHLLIQLLTTVAIKFVFKGWDGKIRFGKLISITRHSHFTHTKLRPRKNTKISRLSIHCGAITPRKISTLKE